MKRHRLFIAIYLYKTALRYCAYNVWITCWALNETLSIGSFMSCSAGLARHAIVIQMDDNSLLAWSYMYTQFTINKHPAQNHVRGQWYHKLPMHWTSIPCGLAVFSHYASWPAKHLYKFSTFLRSRTHIDCTLMCHGVKLHKISGGSAILPKITLGNALCSCIFYPQ